MGFKSALQHGRIAEDAVIVAFQQEGIILERTTPASNADLFAPYEHFSVEVKNDLMAHSTGNFALEYYNPKRNSPSGISTSTANLWAIYISSAIYLTSRKSLYEFWKTQEPVKVVTRAGDGNSSVCLYSLFDLFRICDRIDYPARDKPLRDILVKHLTYGNINDKVDNEDSKPVLEKPPKEGRPGKAKGKSVRQI